MSVLSFRVYLVELFFFFLGCLDFVVGLCLVGVESGLGDGSSSEPGVVWEGKRGGDSVSMARPSLDLFLPLWALEWLVTECLLALESVDSQSDSGVSLSCPIFSVAGPQKGSEVEGGLVFARDAAAFTCVGMCGGGWKGGRRGGRSLDGFGGGGGS